MERFSRTRTLLGENKFNKLTNSNVLVFGVGGVGGYVVEALARSGVGNITVVDKDEVSKSNINRQIIALDSTVGKKKVDAIKERVKDINPNCKMTALYAFYLPENADQIDFSGYDYIVDAIDTVTAKIEIIKRATALDKPVISCTGTANHLDPFAFKIVDVYSTSVCPLARVLRRECKKLQIPKGKVKVLYSTEEPLKTFEQDGDKLSPCSIAFCPSVAGLLIASDVIKSLIR